MFVCLECGEMFEEPLILYDNLGEFWGAPAQDAYGACPNCKSDQIDEADKCDICGEYIQAGYICEDCAEDIQTRVREIKTYIKNNKLNYDEYINYLIEELEG